MQENRFHEERVNNIDSMLTWAFDQPALYSELMSSPEVIAKMTEIANNLWVEVCINTQTEEEQNTLSDDGYFTQGIDRAYYKNLEDLIPEDETAHSYYPGVWSVFLHDELEWSHFYLHGNEGVVALTNVCFTDESSVGETMFRQMTSAELWGVYKKGATQYAIKQESESLWKVVNAHTGAPHTTDFDTLQSAKRLLTRLNILPYR